MRDLVTRQSRQWGRGGRRLFRAVVLALVLSVGVACSVDSLAETPSPEPVDVIPSIAEVASDEPTADPSPIEPTPVPTPEEILPLDAWTEVAPSPTPDPPVVAETPALESEEEEEKWDIPGGASANSKPTGMLLPGEQMTTLNRSERTRFEKVKKLRDSRAIARRRELLGSRARDPRGPKEARVCSLNLQNFGAKPELLRIVKAKGARGLKSREKAIVTAVLDTQCDVVAIQGIVGRSIRYAREGLNTLIERLEKKSEQKWTAVVAQSVKELGFNGFLVRGTVDRLGSKTHLDLALPAVGKKPPEKFARAPFELEVQVRRKGDDSVRRFLFLNFHFQRSLTPVSSESELYRMHMAEVIRELAVEREREERARDPVTAPTVIVLGDLVSISRSAPGFVMSGRLRQADFETGGGCELDTPPPAPSPGKKKPKEEAAPEEEKPAPILNGLGFRCSKLPTHLRVLWNPLLENPPPGPRFERSKKEGVRWIRKSPSKTALQEWKAKRALSSGIYMFQVDLPLARVQATDSLSCNAGAETLGGFPTQSPLVWVDLNW